MAWYLVKPWENLTFTLHNAGLGSSVYLNREFYFLPSKRQTTWTLF